MNQEATKLTEKYVFYMKLMIAVEMICTGALLTEYICNRLRDSLQAELPVVLLIYTLFVILFVSMSVPKINLPGRDDSNIGTAAATLGPYYRVLVILALVALISIMTPNPLGFLISLIVYLFFGLPYRLDVYFWDLSIPMIVRLSLCIAASALFLTAFCFLVRLLFSALFRERPQKPEEDEEQSPLP